jgi:hypothetical protein
MNSNFSQKLLRVQISTGLASIAAGTTVPLQDIENYYSTGLFIAIQEGTSKLMKVDVSGGVCVAFEYHWVIPRCWRQNPNYTVKITQMVWVSPTLALVPQKDSSPWKISVYFDFVT